MSIQHLASELLNLESSKNLNSEVSKVKRPTEYAIVYWPETKIPKGSREEGASATLKAERKEWETKIVKIGGKKIYIHFVLYDITKLRREMF